MKTWKWLLALVIGLGFQTAATPSAEAQARIYKVTFSGKARLRPRTAPAGNSFRHSGYLIYDPANPGQSQTVEVFRNRTYQVNGTMLSSIVPAGIGFGPADLSANGRLDTELALLGFQAGQNIHARAYRGAIPRTGFFRLGGISFFNMARRQSGRGSVSSPNLDLFAVSDTFTLDRMSSALPVNAAAGLVLVQADLARRGRTQVP